MVVKFPKKVSEAVDTNVTDEMTQMFADLSDTEQEIILDPKVQIVNLEAAKQPEAFDLTPDKDSDHDKADEAFIHKYLSTTT